MTLLFTLKGQCLSGKNNMGVARNGRHYPLPRWAKWRDEMVLKVRRAAAYQIYQIPGYLVPIKPMTTPCKATIVFTHADNRRRDVPGMLDALCHVLERAGIVKDDSQIIQWDVSTNLPHCKALAGCTIRMETL